MNFLADMGISMSTVIWLREKGYDSVHVRELGMQRSSDSNILSMAKNENRIVLTCDLDFGALLAASSDTVPSVIIFRLDNETPDNINTRLQVILTEISHHLEKGAIISVEQNRFRVRNLPIK